MADLPDLGVEGIDAIEGFDRLSGTLVVDGEEHSIDADHIVRVGPGVVRKILAGPDGLRLLALGGTPGRAYDSGGNL